MQRPDPLLAEEDGRQIVAFLRSVVAAVPDALIIIDESGTIASFSYAAEKMFGYSAAEIGGENVSVLMPSPDRDRHDGYIARYIETREPHVIGIGRLTTARRRDGSTFPIELSVSEVSSCGRRMFTGFIRDLSAHPGGHRRLQDLHAENADGHRLSQLSGLASAIAHELNQPLSAATNYAEVAQICLEGNEPNVEAALGAIRFCTEEMERSGRIVQRLREFFARGDLSKTRVQLGQLVAEASSIALAEAGAQTNTIWIEPGGERMNVLADRVQIQQVVVNLVRNGIEAADGREGLIVRVGTQGWGPNTVQVTVEDNGPGIPEELLDHLFHPLRTTKPKGTGLGLSICQQIVTAHGGEIWVDRSALGGAAFHFTLPRFPAGKSVAA